MRLIPQLLFSRSVDAARAGGGVSGLRGRVRTSLMLPIILLWLARGVDATCTRPPVETRKIVHYHQHKNVARPRGRASIVPRRASRRRTAQAGITMRAILKRVPNARELHGGRRPHLAKVLAGAARAREFVVTFVRASSPARQLIG